MNSGSRVPAPQLTLLGAGAVASIPGAHISKRYGRTMTMTLAGTSFLVGELHSPGKPQLEGIGRSAYSAEKPLRRAVNFQWELPLLLAVSQSLKLVSCPGSGILASAPRVPMLLVGRILWGSELDWQTRQQLSTRLKWHRRTCAPNHRRKPDRAQCLLATKGWA